MLRRKGFHVNPFLMKSDKNELMALGLDVTVAAISGGAILGIVPGIVAYFITRKIFAKIRSRKEYDIS